MSNPIVIAYHLIWTLYGQWLPNDPRGSTSQVIRRDALKELGELHFGRKRIQPASRDIRAFYEQVEFMLKHPLLELAYREILCVAAGFADAIATHKYTCYACAIMRDHVHLLIRKHRHTAEEMIANLQLSPRLRLSEEALRSPDHPTWVRGGWKVFLDHPKKVLRTISYIDDNPIGYHEPRQQWEFVTPYNNWPLHEGHDPNSPYARRLRAARLID